MSQYREPPPPYTVEYPAVHHFGSRRPGAYPPPTTQQLYPTAPPLGNYYRPPPAQAPFPPHRYGATSTTIVVENLEVNLGIVGACPSCRVGVLEDHFTLLGVFCAILFFPLGILCCLANREKRCSNCRATIG